MYIFNPNEKEEKEIYDEISKSKGFKHNNIKCCIYYCGTAKRHNWNSYYTNYLDKRVKKILLKYGYEGNVSIVNDYFDENGKCYKDKDGSYKFTSINCDYTNLKKMKCEITYRKVDVCFIVATEKDIPIFEVSNAKAHMRNCNVACINPYVYFKEA